MHVKPAVTTCKILNPATVNSALLFESGACMGLVNPVSFEKLFQLFQPRVIVRGDGIGKIIAIVSSNVYAVVHKSGSGNNKPPSLISAR